MQYTPAMKYFDKMVDDAIEQLSDDRVDSGVDMLYELAIVWKSSGADAQSFREICQFIEQQAAERSDSAFVQMKMAAALKKARESRHGLIIH